MPISTYILPPLMLIASNVFMTFAWYGHLKYKAAPLLTVILISWGIALAEYCLAVPANRIGHAVYPAATLKVMQEVITLIIFVGFSFLYLRESLSLSQLVGFGLIAGGAALVILKP
ncbi:MAG: DMT family protein [Paracoccaceae bacterium]